MRMKTKDFKLNKYHDGNTTKLLMFLLLYTKVPTSMVEM